MLNDLWWKLVLRLDRRTHRDPSAALLWLVCGWATATTLSLLLLVR